ncbi:MAG: P-II family nitrogen regulator [Clostridia bacterium]|nr:P-II family nitrogen regulator [Clostridia bacterium]
MAINHELIICIVNTGFTDIVMEAAKEAGARGGTVIHGRGTANKDAEEFFHISIQPDKETVMILVTSDIRDAVLHAIYNSAGLKSAGQGIAFALPVTNVVGISPVATEAPHEKPKDDNAEKTETKPE